MAEKQSNQFLGSLPLHEKSYNFPSIKFTQNFTLKFFLGKLIQYVPFP